MEYGWWDRVGDRPGDPVDKTRSDAGSTRHVARDYWVADQRLSLEPRSVVALASGAFVAELPDAFFDVPVLWVHGHTHQQLDHRARSCRVVCNPRSYVNWRGRIENKAFDPSHSRRRRAYCMVFS